MVPQAAEVLLLDVPFVALVVLLITEPTELEEDPVPLNEELEVVDVPLENFPDETELDEIPDDPLT
jgi:hypothetical protein